MTTKYYKYEKKNPKKLSNKIETMVDDDMFLSLSEISATEERTLSQVSRQAFEEFIHKFKSVGASAPELTV